MQGSDLLKRARDKKARDQRIATAKAHVDALAPDERDELLIVYLAEMEMGVEATSETDATEKPERDPDSGAELESNGAPAAHKPQGYTVKRAIVEAMFDGSKRTAGDLAEATKKKHPWVNEASIPAAIARLVTDGVLVKRGKNGRGHPKYMISPSFAQETGEAE